MQQPAKISTLYYTAHTEQLLGGKLTLSQLKPGQFYFFFQSKHLLLTLRSFHAKSALFLSHDQNSLILRKIIQILNNKSSGQSIVK